MNREIERSARRPIDLAIEHHHAHRFAEAASIYREILETNPDDHDALHLLGVIAVHQGRFQDAIELISRALGSDSSDFHALNHLGEAYLGLKLTEEAMTCFESALRLNPFLCQAHSNLGNTYCVLGKYGAGIACFKKALEINPDYPEALTNLGSALFDVGDYPGAMECHQRAISLRPDFAEAYYSLGSVHKIHRNHTAAIENYRQAIALRPNFADAHLALARSYCEIGERDLALATFHDAKELAPDAPEIRWGTVMAQIDLVADSQQGIEVHRRAFAAGLADLDCWFDPDRCKSGASAIGTQQPFYLAYQEQDNRELLVHYGALCARLASSWQHTQHLDLAPVRRKPATRRLVRVGIASAHVCTHSVWNAITKGWLQNIDRRKFEIYIFSLGTRNDTETEFARRNASEFVSGQGLSKRWAEAILSRELDVLIYPEIGMDPLTAFLGNLRLAPTQVTTWGHPATSGLPTIDYFLSAQNFEPSDAQRHYSEKLVLLPNLGCYSCSPGSTSEEFVDLRSLGVEVDEPLFVCPGTPFKYAPAYDWVYAQIAKHLGKCQFVFFRYPIGNLAEKTMRRIRSTFPTLGLDPDAFIRELPWQDNTRFLSIVRQASAYLDTLGFSGFNTALQALECGVPVVTKDGRFLRGRLASGLLRQIGMQQWIAHSEQDYIDLAVRLARNTRLRAEMCERIELDRTKVYGDYDSILALEAFLASAAQR